MSLMSTVRDGYLSIQLFIFSTQHAMPELLLPIEHHVPLLGRICERKGKGVEGSTAL